MSDSDSKPRNKRPKTTPPAAGPTPSRVCAQTVSTGIPAVRLPPVEVDKRNTDDTIGTPAPAPVLLQTPSKQDTSSNHVKSKGKFATQSYTLKKSKRLQKYGCKLCTKVLDSAQLLTVHHQQKMESCTVIFAAKHLTIPLAWYGININIENSVFIVHVEHHLHSRASYKHTQSYIDDTPLIIVFTQTVTVHLKIKVT